MQLNSSNGYRTMRSHQLACDLQEHSKTIQPCRSRWASNKVNKIYFIQFKLIKQIYELKLPLQWDGLCIVMTSTRRWVIVKLWLSPLSGTPHNSLVKSILQRGLVTRLSLVYKVVSRVTYRTIIEYCNFITCNVISGRTDYRALFRFMVPMISVINLFM